jgi:hypothetical protein
VDWLLAIPLVDYSIMQPIEGLQVVQM